MQIKKQQLELDMEEMTGSNFQEIVKRVCQGCILSPCLLYAEYIMRNAGLDEAHLNQDCRENINNLRYADDGTLMAESEELKSLLMKVKESKNVAFKGQHSES